MNCANHPDRERTAFCQNCGKPLCSECIRTVGSSVFCEPCYAVRTTGTTTSGGFGYAAVPGYTPGAVPPGYTAVPGVPPGPGVPGPGIPATPSPGLAALLGFIPGVGAMYNEQYAKGIVHLMVFAILVSLAHESDIFGLFVMGWIVYQVIEAHHTARARRDGTPLPNPFGLNDLSERLGFGKSWPNSAGAYAPFTASPNPNPAASPNAPDPNAPGPIPPPPNPYAPPAGYAPPPGYAPPYSYVPPVSNWGAPQDAYNYGIPPIPPVPPVPPMPPYDSNLPYYRRVPTGAIWLIGLGIFFLLGNSGIFHLRARFFGPALLIAIGVWMFVRRMTWTGGGLADDGTPAYPMRLALALRGAVWLILIGIIWLLDALHILTWGDSWPILLIAGGIMLLLRHTVFGGYGYGYGPGGYPGYPGYPNTPPTAPPVTTTALVPSDPHMHSGDSSSGKREGR